VAAVSDWRPKSCSDKKLKKDGNAPAPLELENNIDILKTISSTKNRPKFVIGFAAETNNIIENATKKKSRKNCDWIIANDVSGNVMGGNNNKMIVITENKIETWPELTKQESAERLARKIAQKVI
jgi:phosphopantothenoylcysteine decarboxylase/phosphopantothenate--cysteine ligase